MIGVPREISFAVDDSLAIRRSGRTQFTSLAISIREPQFLSLSVGVCDWPGHAYVARQIFAIPSNPQHFAKFIAATQFPRGPLPLIVGYQGYAVQNLRSFPNSAFGARVFAELEQALAAEGVQYELIWEDGLVLQP
jgi:hypothetical protein